MKIANYAVLLSVIILFGCLGNQTRDCESPSMNFDSTLTTICTLNENINILGAILSFNFINDTQFVVSGTGNIPIYIYNISGEQEGSINRFGKGPYEYMNAAIVKCHNNNIYVWCDQLLKLIVLDNCGNPIAEYKEFGHSIKDFIPYDNLVCFYMSGGDENIIKVYDTVNQSWVGKYKISTAEHELLSINDCSGGLKIHNNKLLFAPADALCLSEVSLCNEMTYRDSIKIITDNEFVVKNLNSNANELINSNREYTFQYLQENSCVNGLFILGDNIVIKAKVGRYNVTNNRIENIDRCDKFYIMNEDLDLLNTFKFKQNTKIKDCLWEAYNDKLFCIMYDDYAYKLNVLDLYLLNRSE